LFYYGSPCGTVHDEAATGAAKPSEKMTVRNFAQTIPDFINGIDPIRTFNARRSKPLAIRR
jgi:hypothetical protein